MGEVRRIRDFQRAAPVAAPVEPRWAPRTRLMILIVAALIGWMIFAGLVYLVFHLFG
jgi:LPS O-antigen subunit length determinant protein (WzzB/FepE family)